MTSFVSATAGCATGLGAALTIYAFLTQVATDAVAIVNYEATAETLRGVGTFHPVRATNVAAHQLFWTAFIVFADLADFAADVVTNISPRLTTKPGSTYASVSRLAAVFVATTNQAFRTTDADLCVETRFAFVAAGDVATTHWAARISGVVTSVPTLFVD